MTPEERALQVLNDMQHLRRGMGDAVAQQIIVDAIENAVEEAEVQVRAKGRLITAIEVANEREACAKVAELYYTVEPEANNMAHRIAAAIRGRNDAKPERPD